VYTAFPDAAALPAGFGRVVEPLRGREPSALKQVATGVFPCGSGQSSDLALKARRFGIGGFLIEFRVLGSVELRGADGEEILSVLRQPKRIALLTYLGVARPRAFHRKDELVDLFWPESNQQQARAALRRSLYFLRHALGRDAILSRGREEVGLNWEWVRCDARDLDEALTGGKNEQATDLFRGDLLPAFFLSGCPGFERWLEVERGRIRDATAAAAWALAHRWVETGLVSDGTRMAKRALSMVESDEENVRTFLSSLEAAENPAAAVDLYDGFAHRLREDLGMEPSAETRALVAKIRLGNEANDPEETR